MASNESMAEQKYGGRSLQISGDRASNTAIEHLASLELDITKHIRMTGIICTIGPKSNTPEKIAELRQCGLNIVRMNFSHGSYEYHRSIIDNTLKSYDVFPNAKREVGIALDTKGPEIRTGLLKTDTITVEKGSKIVLTTDAAKREVGTAEELFIDYEHLAHTVKVGQIVYVADGSLTLEVTAIDPAFVSVTCVAHNTAKFGSRKNVALPLCKVDLPALSEKDKKDLAWGVENNVDIIFASFIRKKEDILEIRQALGEKGKDIKVVAKIENFEGVHNIDSIIEVADGIMVARGDLGMDLPPQKVFLAQKKIIAKCNIAGKPVICATQMLESMILSPRPTRAEVTDVANAVLDGADCVMLSGETANGEYPHEAVSVMSAICAEAEAANWNNNLYSELIRVTPTPVSVPENIAAAAVNACFQQPVAAIVVLSTSGTTARWVAKYRPRCPIICITRNQKTQRQMHLCRGIVSVWYDTEKKDDEKPVAAGTEEGPGSWAKWQNDVDLRLKHGVEIGRDMGFLKCQANELVVLIQGWHSGSGYTNTMRIVNTALIIAGKTH